MTGQIAVVLVDDQLLVANNLQTCLESFPDILVAGIAISGEEVLEKLPIWNPQVVLMDMQMPGGMDGVTATQQVKSRFPAIQIIGLTNSADEGRILGLLRAGASGYVRKDASGEVLVSAIRAVASGQHYMDAPPTIGSGNSAEELSPRETDVMLQMAFGRSNKEIAEALTITEETVKSHVGNLLAKLHLENRTQAVVYALKRGLVSLEELG